MVKQFLVISCSLLLISSLSGSISNLPVESKESSQTDLSSDEKLRYKLGSYYYQRGHDEKITIKIP